MSHKPLINHKKEFLLKGPVTKSLVLLGFHDGAFQENVSKRLIFTLLTHSLIFIS